MKLIFTFLIVIVFASVSQATEMIAPDLYRGVNEISSTPVVCSSTKSATPLAPIVSSKTSNSLMLNGIDSIEDIKKEFYERVWTKKPFLNLRKQKGIKTLPGSPDAQRRKKKLAQHSLE